MRKKFFLLLFLTAAASVCGFFVWKTVFGESDQQIIERRMREVFQMMGKTGSELLPLCLSAEHLSILTSL